MGSSLSAIVFQPPLLTYSHSNNQILSIPTRRNSIIPAIYIDRNSHTTFLYSHGNAEDIGMIYDALFKLAVEMEVNILFYDYAGYGRAYGVSSEQCCYEDIDAAYEYLTVNKGFPSHCIILYGASIGSGPSCYLAERLSKENIKLGGLILQSAMLSIFRIIFPFRFTLLFDMFVNIDRISNINCPILSIHGVHDEIVPFWNGEQLWNSAPIQWRARPYWVEDAGHNDIAYTFQREGQLFEQIREFLLLWVPVYSGLPFLSKDSSSSQYYQASFNPVMEATGIAEKSKPNLSRESFQYTNDHVTGIARMDYNVQGGRDSIAYHKNKANKK